VAGRANRRTGFCLTLESFQRLSWSCEVKGFRNSADAQQGASTPGRR
jgi:hypothetical protein